MKINKSFLYISATICIIFLYSCDDAGLNPVFVTKGQISFTQLNLKPLDQNIDGLYSLWLGLDSSGNTLWYNLGQFNINTFSQIVDAQGNAMVFTFPGDTNMLGNSRVATVTVGNSGPLGTVLVSNSLTVNSDSITGTLWIADALAFGEVGLRLYGQGYPVAHTLYHLSSPTTNNNQCRQGLWFCDTLGNSTFSDGLRLDSGNGWVYEGWLNDKSTDSFYSTGRFYDPYNADLDGAGLCAGTSGPPFNKPGQDWITSGTGCPNITNISNGNYAVFISVEPENESGQALSTPFFLEFFNQSNIVTSVGCKRLDNVFNVSVAGVLPKGRLRITN